MLTLSIILVLLSNAINTRRDLAILYNRIAIVFLVYCVFNDYSNLMLINKGVAIQGGIILTTNITLIFHVFISFISALNLTLTSFYSRKALFDKFSTIRKYILMVLFYLSVVIIIFSIYYFYLYPCDINFSEIFSSQDQIRKIIIPMYNKLLGEEKSLILWIGLVLDCICTYFLFKNFYDKHNIFKVKPGIFKFLILFLKNKQWSILSIVGVLLLIHYLFITLLKPFVNTYLFGGTINGLTIFIGIYLTLPFISFVLIILFHWLSIFLKSAPAISGHLLISAPDKIPDLNLNFINNTIANSFNIYRISSITFISYISLIGIDINNLKYLVIMCAIILPGIILIIPNFFFNYLLGPIINMILSLILSYPDIESALIRILNLGLFNNTSYVKMNIQPDFQQEVSKFEYKKEIRRSDIASTNEWITNIRRWEDEPRGPKYNKRFINPEESIILKLATAFQSSSKNQDKYPIISTFALLNNWGTKEPLTLGFHGGSWINSDSSNNRTLNIIVNPSYLEERKLYHMINGELGVYSVKGNNIKQDLAKHLGYNLSSYDFNKVLVCIPFKLFNKSHYYELNDTTGYVDRSKPTIDNILIKPHYVPNGFKIETQGNKWSLTNPEDVFSPDSFARNSFKRWNHIQEFIEKKNPIEYINDKMLYVTSSEYGAQISIGNSNNWLVYFTKEPNNKNLPWFFVSATNIPINVNALFHIGIDTNLILNSNGTIYPNKIGLMSQGLLIGNGFIKFPILSPHSEQANIIPHSLKIGGLDPSSLYFGDRKLHFKDNLTLLAHHILLNSHYSSVTLENFSRNFLEGLKNDLFGSTNLDIITFNYNINAGRSIGEVLDMFIRDNSQRIIFCNSVNNVFDGISKEGISTSSDPSYIKFPSFVSPNLKSGLYDILNDYPFNPNSPINEIHLVFLDKLSMELGILDYKTNNMSTNNMSITSPRHLQYYTVGYMKDNNSMVTTALNLLDSGDHNILIEFLNKSLNGVPNNNQRFNWRN